MNRKIFIKISVIVIMAIFIYAIPGFITQKKGLDPGKLQFNIDMSGLKPLYAQEHDTWTGVRFVATAARLINANVEAFMTALNSAVSMSETLTGEWDGNYTYSDTSFTYKLGLNMNYTATNSVDGVQKTYNHGYMLCLNSTAVYQIFFDSPTDPGSGDGVLLIYKPANFAAYFTHSTAANVVVEFTLTGSSGARTEVMSWTGGPLFSDGTVTEARIVITEGDSGNLINFFGAAKLNTTHCSGTTDYYAIAFIAKTASPHYSTGKWGLTADAIPALDDICSAANATTYGIFNSTDGKVNEGVASTDIPSDYPTAADVDTLFTGISSDSDLEKDDIDNLSSNINFSGSITCP